MRIKKIECLCEVFMSSFDPGTSYRPLGEYKLFYQDGTSEVKDQLLKSEMESSPSIEMVEKFSYEIK